MCDAACLELGEDSVPLMIVVNSLQMIGNKIITFDNAFPLRNQALISQRKAKYVEGIIVTRDMAKLWMSRKELIQKISDIGQASSYVEA